MLATGIILFIVGLLLGGLIGLGAIKNIQDMMSEPAPEVRLKRHLELMAWMIPTGIITFTGIVLIIISLIRG